MSNIELARAVELIQQEITEIDKRHEALEAELQQWIMTANKTQGHISENRQQRDRLTALLEAMLNPSDPNSEKEPSPNGKEGTIEKR